MKRDFLQGPFFVTCNFIINSFKNETIIFSFGQMYDRIKSDREKFLIFVKDRRRHEENFSIGKRNISYK